MPSISMAMETFLVRALHWLYELSGGDYRYCNVCPRERDCYDDPYYGEADDDYYEDEDDIHWRCDDEPF